MASSPIKLPSRSARKEHAREKAYSKYTLGKPRDKKSNCFSRAFWCCGNGDDSELGSLPSEASFPDAQTYQALPPVRSRDRDIPPPTSLRPASPFRRGAQPHAEKSHDDYSERIAWWSDNAEPHDSQFMNLLSRPASKPLCDADTVTKSSPRRDRDAGSPYREMPSSLRRWEAQPQRESFDSSVITSC